MHVLCSYSYSYCYMCVPAADADGRCLGAYSEAPSHNRWGVVLSPGVMRAGILRNMLVVADDGSGRVRQSLYSSSELMPLSRASVFTKSDRDSLVQTIRDLNHALTRKKGAILSPEILVDKFGADVFSKLWVMFEKNQSYELALGAFQQWQSSRKTAGIRKLAEI